MARTSGGYDAGKRGESQTWEYLSSHGYVRPSPAQRRNIVAAFKAIGIPINARGFDAFHAALLPLVDSVDALMHAHETITLYEVKTCGVNRKAQVSPGFRGLGFTLTRKELDNATVLGARYRFVFVNLRTRHHRECAVGDFFNPEHSRLYETWSVFLNRDLPDVLFSETYPEGALHHGADAPAADDKANACPGRPPDLPGLFLHLCCEGWLSVGPFKLLSFSEDMTRVADESGQVIAKREAGTSEWVCTHAKAAGMLFNGLAVTNTREHPQPSLGCR